MLVNFSGIDFKKKPQLVLRDLEGTALGYLGYALNLRATLNYNSVSEISFEYPSQVEGREIKEFDMLTSMRIIDMVGVGQFILRNPSIVNDGIVQKKSCTAYSLEYELTNKIMMLEEGSYNFYNPFALDSTVMGEIISLAPSWHIGTISRNLYGKYRTLTIENQNIYDVMKSTLQDTYQCVFDFDTYNREINVISIEDIIATNPVYLSTRNLLREISIDENTDDLVTVLDVNGAEGVNIRSVNPMGLNKIYNLDYYMNTEYFSSSIITKWNNWKNTFNQNQSVFYNKIVLRNMMIAKLSTANAKLTELKGELSGLEIARNTLIQMIAVDESTQSALNQKNAEITAKESQITSQEGVITGIETQIAGVTTELNTIIYNTSFERFFNSSEITMLDKYFKEGSITDSSFVASNIRSYNTSDIINDISNITFSIADTNRITESEYSSDITFYSISGGDIVNGLPSGSDISNEIISATLQVNSDNSMIFSAYLNTKVENNTELLGGTLSISGTGTVSYYEGSPSISFTFSTATSCFTQEVSEYQKLAIQWDLYEYGKTILDKLSSPTYTFSVRSANFLSLNDFELFAKEFSLGEKIYLDLDGRILNPIAVSVSIEFDNLASLEIGFSDTFHAGSEEFTLESILENTISMGKTLDLNQYNYNNFVSSGAQTSVKTFMNSALDAMKNNILAGVNEDVVIDEKGIRLRKFDTQSQDYEDEQLWITNNSIMFTDDNWTTGTIGIGKFKDTNLGEIYGVVAPAIVGTILAGENLIIESDPLNSGDGVRQFKVDSSGVSIHNSILSLYDGSSVSQGGSSRIDINPTLGIVAGQNWKNLFVYDSYGNVSAVKTSDSTAHQNGITNINDLGPNETINASFWIDMYGNAYFAGKLIATTGVIGGWTIANDYLYAGSGTNYVALNGSGSTYSTYAIWAGAENPANAPFYVTKTGDIYAEDGTFGGSLSGADGTFSGTLVAADGTFTGTLQAGTIDASTINASTISGNLTAANTGGWLVGAGIAVGGSTSATLSPSNFSFFVDSNGNLTMSGNLTTTGTTSITSPTINGGDFYGVRYYGAVGSGYVEVGHPSGGYGDFGVYSSNNNSVFKVVDGGGYCNFSSFGHIFLVGNSTGATTQGNWTFQSGSTVDFTGVTVTGLSAQGTVTAVWG